MEFRDLKTKHIEAEAFQAGTQGVEAEAQLNELEAGFSELKQRVIQASTARIKRLEALISNLKRRIDEAQDYRSDLQMRSDGMPPPVVLPLIVVTLTVLVVIGEAVFLAPVTDALGIADPTSQLIFAAVIVVVTSGLVDITKHQLMSHAETAGERQTDSDSDSSGRFARYLKIVTLVLLSVLSLTLVFFLGSWRAEQLIFAASLQHSGAWKQFMNGNPELTRAVVVLLTTGLPIFVAIVFDWGLSGLQFAWEWRKTRHQYHSFSKKLDGAQKKLEAEEEARASRMAELDEKCKEWKSSYEHHHALGKQIGAWKTPLWRVILKIAAVVCVIAAACFILDQYAAGYIASTSARLLIYTLLSLGVGGLYAARAVRAWDRPTAKQLLKQRATIWRDALPANTTRAHEEEDAATAKPNALNAERELLSAQAQAARGARA